MQSLGCPPEEPPVIPNQADMLSVAALLIGALEEEFPDVLAIRNQALVSKDLSACLTMIAIGALWRIAVAGDSLVIPSA